MATTTRTDAKAGFCQWCRQGDHGVCASATCKCQVVHRSRPGFGRAANGGQAAEVQRNGGGSASTPAADDDGPLADVRRRANGAASRSTANGAAKAKLSEPVWALVKADPPAPPAKPKRLTVVERARPFLESILEADSRDWHRVAIFPTTMGAAQTVGRLRKAYSRGEWEWKAARVPDIGQSAVYVRWLGKAKELL